MKNLLIILPKMSMGGMERSCANLLKLSNYSKDFKVTLLVGYITDDTLFKDIPENISVKVLYRHNLDYIGKIIVALKFLIIYIKSLLGFVKYDVSICYSHHHASLAKLAKASSNNSIVFIHSDLKAARSAKQIKKMKFEGFKKVVCVSNAAKDVFITLFPNYDKNNIFVINNYIDGEKIISLSDEKIEEDINFDKTTFINISRHVENPKRITRILEAAKSLKKEGYNFQVLLVGDGPDFNKYREYIQSESLEDIVIMVGNKPNPYNYLKKSSAFVFSTSFEGYGMVLDEARLLNVPLITTDVADAKYIIRDGFGILCDNSSEGVYFGMKKFLDEGFNLTKKFNYIEFNDNITKNLDFIARERN